LVQVLSTDLKGNDKFWFPSLKAPKFDLPKSKGLEKTIHTRKYIFLPHDSIFFYGKLPNNIFSPEKGTGNDFWIKPSPLLLFWFFT